MALFGGNRSVAVSLKADVSGYLASMRVAQKATQDFAHAAGQSATKNRADWDKLGRGMLVAGGAIGAGLALAVKSAADFDKQLSAVRSVSNASAADMDRLRTAALKAGADTSFSAKQAAEAETELAKVGLSTADILGGALNGSLSLAAAGQIDLGRAATISGQSMKIFGLQGKDVGHIADVLASGANKSAADVDQLSQAMSAGGLVAAQTGLSLEDTVGTLSAFADNALIGSDAGTSLKTMLQRLNPQSDQAAALMDQLGLRAFDAQGNFVGLEKYAGQLQKGLGGLSTEQRNAAMSTIFGSDAIRASNILVKLGAAGVHEYTSAVNDQGAAARTAAIQMDNLSGDFEQLKGSIETALIKSGSAGNGALRGLTQTATRAVNAFGSLPQGVQSAGFALGAVASSALLVGGTVVTLVPKIAATKASLDALGISAARTSVAMRGPGAAAAVVAVGAVASELGSVVGQAQAANVATSDLAKSLSGLAANGRLSGAAFDVLSTRLGPFHDNVGTSAEALDRFGVSAYNALDQGWDARLGRFQSMGTTTARFKDQVGQLDNALASMVQAGNADQAAVAFNRLTAAAVKQGVPLASIRAQFKGYQQALDTASVASGGAAKGTARLTGAVERAKPPVKSVEQAVKDFSDALQALDKDSFSAGEAADAFHGKLNDLKAAVKSNGTALTGNSDKAIANRDAMRAAARAAFDAIDKYAQNGHTQDEVARKADQYRRELRKQAEQAGFSRSDVDKYTGALKRVPTAIKSAFTTPGLDAATGKVKTLRQAILDIPRSRSVSIAVATGIANKVASQNTQLTKRAFGGYISGPGGPTEDAIPAYLSNGEYVVRAASVAKYGTEMLDMLNAGRFANGGQVGTDVTIRGSADLAGALNPVVAAIRQAAASVRAATAAASAGAAIHGGSVGGGVARWAPLVLRVLRELGQSPALAPGVLRRIRFESGGNPNAINLTDINAQQGHPSRGLMQTIPGTFNAYAGPYRGRGIVDPLASIYAGLNYALHRYGSIASIDPINRPRGYARGGQVGRSPRRFAAGGPVTGGDYSSIASIVAARQTVTAQDRSDRAAALRKAQADLTAATKALTVGRRKDVKAEADARGSVRTARAGLADARRSHSHSRIVAATERLAAAERRLAAARRDPNTDRAEVNLTKRREALAKATDALHTTDRALRAQSRPLSVRYAEAAYTRNRVTGTFLRNLRTLADRGFGDLARQLTEMGGADAETLAAQAVRSTATARKLQTDFTVSARLQGQLAGAPAELAIRSALRTMKNPSLAGIAAATGLSTSDLQASLQAISGTLRGNGNAKTLLAGIRSQGFYSNGSFGSTTAASGPSFHITVQNPTGDPYRAGEKAAQGVQRVLAVQGAW